MYHPECVGLSPFYSCPDNNYVCKVSKGIFLSSFKARKNFKLDKVFISSKIAFINIKSGFFFQLIQNCGNYQPKIGRNETHDGLTVNSNQIEQSGLEIKQNGVQPPLMIDPEHLKQCLVTIADKKFIMVPKNVPLSMKHFSDNVQSSLSVYNNYKIGNSFDQSVLDVNNSLIKQRNDHLNS